MEAKRLSEKYGKDYLDANDLSKIMRIGLNNARSLLNNMKFPTLEIGKRKIVSVAAFALWGMENHA